MCVSYDSEGNTIYGDARDKVDRLREAADTAQAAIDGVASALADAEEDGRVPPNAAETLADIAMMLRTAVRLAK